ncbi:Aspartate aminotransferase [Candidatus Bilamarchaeum dharawalense]|uniref:Aspartate aminotransferase n=1 Tax=Candidatus Bilamarchaeum dharawalense TaxID=2885759 RepID=A0A5E4LTM7_9ARCH|nr:Aspartate aminotransferase [Candidatus Bilamarchaeum dharawalense]
MIPIAKPLIEQDEIDNVVSVLKSGQLAQGRWVEEFENEFAKYIGVEYAIAVVNGTVALDLALKALNIKAGDEVIVPAFTFIATANTALFQGAKPIFADIDERTFNLDPESVKERITPKTKAIIPVHLFGQAADIQAFVDITEDHRIALVEDCAQAHGARYKGKRAGGFGIGTFSFYGTKNMTTGEGGMITTNNETIAKRLRLLRNHGQSEKYLHTELGYNYRMTNIAAAIGICQLKKLDRWNGERRKNAKYLDGKLKDIRGLTVPYVAPHNEHVYHQYVVKLGKDRDKIKEELATKGVGTAVHYPIPLNKQPVYSKEKTECPVSERMATQVLSLPVHPAVTEEQIVQVAKAVEEVLIR